MISAPRAVATFTVGVSCIACSAATNTGGAGNTTPRTPTGLILEASEGERATSVPEGSQLVPLSPDEVRAIRRKYQDHIAFKSP